MLTLPDPRDFLIYGAAAGLLLLAAGAGIQTVRLGQVKTELATEVADRAKVEAERERAAREHVQKIAGLEAAHALSQQRLADEYQKQIDLREAAAVAAASDNDQLRDHIDQFVAACVGTGKINTVTCSDLRNRAATLGDLLQEASKLAEVFAVAAERHATEVRALKRALVEDRLACQAL